VGIIEDFHMNANTRQLVRKGAYDAFVAVNGMRAKESLKGLLPGESHRFDVASGGVHPKLEIECDRLVPGQRIGFEANLK
jgi:hypothetical protein